ncbi:MAG: hypothetical protein H7345_18740 [Rubritepida sp.]|nr:hypothetical protein [Rubritepida sp.]
MADLDISDDVVAWFENATPVRHEAGDWVAEGPIGQAGWYVEPFCGEGCCGPFGPFAAAAAASQWARGWAPTLAGTAPESAEFLVCRPVLRPGGRRGA